MSPVSRSCYCAFCKTPRHVRVKKHASVKDVLYAFSVGIVWSLLIWQEINFKFLPFSITWLGLTEVWIQVRWRMSLICQKCGFDPMLYIRNPQLAAERVRQKYEDRLANPLIFDKVLPVMKEKAQRKSLILREENKVGHEITSKI